MRMSRTSTLAGFGLTLIAATFAAGAALAASISHHEANLLCDAHDHGLKSCGTGQCCSYCHSDGNSCVSVNCDADGCDMTTVDKVNPDSGSKGKSVHKPPVAPTAGKKL
jgi:hypothetical protein